LFIWIVLGVFLLIVSINDFLFFRIENEYVLSLIVLYVLSCVLGISGVCFLKGLMAAVLVFVLTFILNQFNCIGGGDVKLFFPVILFSENNLSDFLIGMSVCGAILSAVFLLFNKQIFFFRRKLVRHLYVLYKSNNKHCLLNIVLLSLSRIDKRIVALRRYEFNAMKQEIPYGVAISCGVFYVIFENLVVRW